MLLFYLVWNLIVLGLYGTDKRRAKQGKWRISEKTLLLAAVFMGGLGALFGMSVFRHKTQHLKFKLGVPAAAVVNLAAVFAYIFLIRGRI